jgi:hypothetical protein
MGYIKLAHQLIPDGFNIDLDVDPETRQFVVTAIDSEGQAQKHVVDPRAIPGLLQKAIDGSAYWDSMFRIGHPSLAGQRETRAIRAEERAYDEQQEEKKYERGQEDILEREDRAAARKLFEHNLKMDEGSTEGERRRISDQRYYDDWTARFDEAAPEDKQALVDEGLQYRYEHTPNRSRPIDDEAITTTVTAMEDQFGDDIEDVADIARSIGVKNGVLDGVGAANVAAALITDPLDIGRGLSAGTLEVNGNSLVFNPALLPRLSTLRKKYRQQ